MMYLCSSSYDPDREDTILATDPKIGIEWPAADSVRMSARDREAPTLAAGSRGRSAASLARVPPEPRA